MGLSHALCQNGTPSSFLLLRTKHRSGKSPGAVLPDTSSDASSRRWPMKQKGKSFDSRKLLGSKDDIVDWSGLFP